MDLETWSGSQRVIPELLGADDFDEFLAQHWERSTKLVSGGVPKGLLGLDKFERLVWAGAGSSDLAPSIVSSFTARPLVNALGDARYVRQVLDSFDGGATILLPGIQYRDPIFARICRQFDNALLLAGLVLARASAANAYLTPPYSQGFGIHYDNHCGFILQVSGSKRWRVFEPSIELPLDRCVELIPAQELGRKVLEIELHPGDLLYLPRGFPHYAESTDQMSLHVTVSVFASTWADLVTSAARQLPQLRQSIRPVSVDGTSAAAFFENTAVPVLRTSPIGDLLNLQLHRSLSALPPLPATRLAPSSVELSPETTVRRVPLALVLVDVDEDGSILLTVPGETISLPPTAIGAVEFIADTETFRLAELEAIAGDYETRTLMHKMICAGVVEICTPKLPKENVQDIHEGADA